jgi:hypothetical protein
VALKKSCNLCSIPMLSRHLRNGTGYFKQYRLRRFTIHPMKLEKAASSAFRLVCNYYRRKKRY